MIPGGVGLNSISFRSTPPGYSSRGAAILANEPAAFAYAAAKTAVSPGDSPPLFLTLPQL